MGFETIQVQRDDASIQSYLQRYKDFRLLSLQLAPEMFGSTYEREVAFTNDTWYGRLANPQATTFITLQGERVVGSLTVIGPLSFRPSESSPMANPRNSLDDGEQPSYWHSRINGMFTAPDVRRRGVGKALLEKAIKFGKDEATKSGKEYVASIVVNSENAAAKGLYERYGYMVIKEEPRSPGSTWKALLMEYSLTPKTMFIDHVLEAVG